MNRKARRAEKAKARKALPSKDIPIVAIHEAGHAVAKVVTIGELGYGLGEAIEDIEIMSEQSGVTHGHMFSRDIEEGSHGFKRTYLSGRGAPCGPDVSALLAQVVQHGRAAGANIDRWFCARTFDAVSGPMAEAIYCNWSFRDVWESDHAMGDRSSVASDALLAEIPAERIFEVIDRMAALSAHIMQKPSVWTAVLTLAKALPAVGRMPGSHAITCIVSAIPQRMLPSLFSEGVFYIHDIEVAIREARVVVAAGPFKPLMDVIKGRQLVQEAIQSNRQTIPALTITCQREITAETLWRAFGDGSCRPVANSVLQAEAVSA